MLQSLKLSRINWKYLLYAGVFLMDFVLFLKFCYPAAEINQFFIRDIIRTKEILSGHFIGVGPDFTSGTYAPGPFYYFILAPIVFFTKRPELVLVYLFSLKMGIQYFFSRSLEKIFSVSFLYFYLLLSASPIMMRSFYWPNNSALIIPIGQLLSLFAAWYYLASPKYKLQNLILVSVTWGLCLQVHFSFILAGPVLFFLIGDKNHSPSGRAKDTGLFILFALAPLIPFVVTSLRANSFQLIDSPVFYVRDFGFSFFFKSWGLQMGRTFSSLPELDRFHVFYSLIYFYTMLKGLWILFSKKAAERNFYERFFLSLTLLTFIMSAWILSGRIMRYYSLLYSLSYLILIIDLHQLLSQYIKQTRTKILIAGMAYVISWYSLYDFYRNLGLEARCENCVLQIEKICDFMNSKGISYQEFSNSSYELMEEFNEGSAELSGDCFSSQARSLPGEKKRYLIAHTLYLDDESLAGALSRLPKELMEVYSKDRLELELSTPGFSLYSVTLKDLELSTFPRLTNLAYFYEIDPAFGEGYYLSKFRESGQNYSRAQVCATPLFCDLFVKNSFREGLLTLELSSRVFQTKYDLDPVSARAQGLSLNYTCDGKPAALPIVSTLGASNGADQNSSFFTPLITAVKLPCKEIQLTSFSVDKIDLFYTKTGMDHLKGQEYKLHELK